jgi:hypothetical protein
MLKITIGIETKPMLDVENRSGLTNVMKPIDYYAHLYHLIFYFTLNLLLHPIKSRVH